jgi:hypothetical protein
MYPSSMGPSPLYRPRTPSSIHITRAVPVRPLYTARVGPVYCRGRKEPCACRRVLMTSSGQVTMPEATPAEAPHSALTDPSGSLATLTASFVMGELQALWFWGFDISRDCMVTAEGAYRSGTLVGDGGSDSWCVDIGGTVEGQMSEPFTRIARVNAYRPSSPLQCLSARTPQHSSNTVASDCLAPLTCGGRVDA